MSASRNATDMFKNLSGVFCVFKPPQMSFARMRSVILGRICSELNEASIGMDEKSVQITGATNDVMSVEIVDNYASHPLVCGPKYIQEDLKFAATPKLERNTSGVCVFGIGEGTKTLWKCKMSQLTRAFKIHGVLGSATTNMYKDGVVLERASYKSISKMKVDHVISYMQTTHQRKMYELLGVDIQSQTAYELAKLGPIRPEDNKLPVLYGIKCVHFDPPNFTIEIQSINEYEQYFYHLIHDIGLQLRSVAHCTGIQCIRYGVFTIEHALLRKHWNLRNILNSIETCDNILKKNKKIFSHSPVLR